MSSFWSSSISDSYVPIVFFSCCEWRFACSSWYEVNLRKSMHMRNDAYVGIQGRHLAVEIWNFLWLWSHFVQRAVKVSLNLLNSLYRCSDQLHSNDSHAVPWHAHWLACASWLTLHGTVPRGQPSPSGALDAQIGYWRSSRRKISNKSNI